MMARSLHSFTGRDYTAILEWLIAQMRAAVPELSDFNHSSVLMALLRVFARKTDLIQLYIDNAFNEGNVETARFMQSLIDLGTLVDVRPNLSSPAATTLRISRAFGEEGLISIPAHSEFTRADGLVYSTIEADSIPIGEEYVDVSAYQGLYETISVGLGDWEAIDSGGRYRYNLGVGVVEASVSMEDGNQQVWERVSSFYRSQADDFHFRVDIYADKYDGVSGSCFVTLGDGVYGTATPPITAEITLLRTSGKSGNSGIATITLPPSGLAVTASNITVANGGDDVESLESFRARLPMVVRTQRRGLTVDDYTTLIGSVPGIASCQVVDRNTDVDWPYLYMFVYVHPSGGGAVSELLEATIMEQCLDWGHLGDWEGRYVVLSATEVPVDFTITVGKSSGYTQQDVTDNINTALGNLLDPVNVTVGETLRMADIVLALNAVSGVAWYTVASPQSDVTISNGEVPALGTVLVQYA